jgi:hypothetical protein
MIATIVFLAVAVSRVLPSVTVQNLAGEQVVLPRDLGQVSVFVAGFESRARCETEPGPASGRISCRRRRGFMVMST